MGNNGFSHSSRLGLSTSSPPNAGESQPRQQNGEQEQQGTFSGRPTTSYDPENSYLTSLFTSHAANLRASTSATATSTTVQYPPATEYLVDPFLTVTSASQPIDQISTASGPAMTEPIEDPFAALAALQPIIFEEDRPQPHCGLHSFRVLSDTYLPEGLEEDFPVSLEVTNQPLGQAKLALMMDDSPALYSQGADSPSQGQPKAAIETAIETAVKTSEQISNESGSFPEAPQDTQEVSCQDNPPANPHASHRGHASAPVPNVMAASGMPLSPVRPVVGPSPPSQRPSEPNVSPSLRIIGKVKVRKGKERPTDKYLLRTNSIERPYMCGFPNCGMTYKSSGHLRDHIFWHTGVSEHRCTHPQCGPDKYFRSKADFQRHIERMHPIGQEWSCVVCHRIFESLETLQAHMSKRHYIPLK